MNRRLAEGQPFYPRIFVPLRRVASRERVAANSVAGPSSRGEIP